MNSAAPASRAARSTCSSDASGSANAMFSRTESENRNVSSNTMPTALPQLVDPQVADVDAVEQHAPAVDVVEARDEPRHGRLAAAGRTDERDRLAAADGEVETVEHPATRSVAERHALEPQLTRARRERGPRRVRRRSPGRSSRISCTRPAPADARDACAMSIPIIRSGQISMRM